MAAQDPRYGVSAASMQEHVGFKDTSGGAFAQLKNSMVKEWVKAHHVRQFKNTAHERDWTRHGPSHTFDARSRPGPNNVCPQPFEFDKHDEIWYTREFGDEYSKDSVFALVFRGGKLYMPLVWWENLATVRAAAEASAAGSGGDNDDDVDDDDAGDDDDGDGEFAVVALDVLVGMQKAVRDSGKKLEAELLELVRKDPALADVFRDTSKQKGKKPKVELGSIYKVVVGDAARQQAVVRALRLRDTRTYNASRMQFIVAAALCVDAIKAMTSGLDFEAALTAEIDRLDAKMAAAMKTGPAGEDKKWSKKVLDAAYKELRESTDGKIGKVIAAKPKTVNSNTEAGELVATYRCVETVAAPVAAMEGRVLKRVSLAADNADRQGHANAAAMVNTAMVLRAKASRGKRDDSFMDNLTGNTYCADDDESGMLAAKADACMTIVKTVLERKTGWEVLGNFVLSALPMGCLPTNKLWESRGYRALRKLGLREKVDMGFAEIEERWMDFVATGGLRGDMAPNVYAVLLEHRIDTARFGLSSTASFLGTASHNVLDYAYKLFGGAAGDLRRLALDVVKTYPAVTAAVGVAAYDAISAHLVASRGQTRKELADTVEAGVTATLENIAVSDGGCLVLRPDHVVKEVKSDKVTASVEFKTRWGKRAMARSTVFDYKCQALIQGLAVNADYAVLHIVTVPYERVPTRVHSRIFEADLRDGEPGRGYAELVAEAVKAVTKPSWKEPWHRLVAGTVGTDAPGWKENVRVMARYRNDGTVMFATAAANSGTLIVGRRSPQNLWEEDLDRLVKQCFADP